jgi:hypothetical protein
MKITEKFSLDVMDQIDKKDSFPCLTSRNELATISEAA